MLFSFLQNLVAQMMQTTAIPPAAMRVDPAPVGVQPIVADENLALLNQPVEPVQAAPVADPVEAPIEEPLEQPEVIEPAALELAIEEEIEIEEEEEEIVLVAPGDPVILAEDDARLLNFEDIVTVGAPAAVQVSGLDAQVFNFRNASIDANNDLNVLATGIDVTGSAQIRNFGEISGDFNGVSFTGEESTGTLDNFRGGVITSNSRGVQIQGEGVELRNFGDILGTGDQRNGTVYTNSTAEDVTISNFSGATIDAGEGNRGAGVSFEVGDTAGDVVSNTLFNGVGATIQGRGQAESTSSLAGDGIRINNGAEGTVSDTDIVNAGLISSESTQGTTAGLRIADGVSVEGTIVNTSTGVIEGAQNGLYIGQADHDLEVINAGTIQSDSRAFNIDGTGVSLVNSGDILGTGDQRNGTVYADGTANDFIVENLSTGTIDAGAGNEGSGFGAEIEGLSDFGLFNDGLIQGRGNASAGLNGAGDGVRIGNVGNAGNFIGEIVNNGVISSEGANGTVAGLRVVNNIDFAGGTLINDVDGLIEGTQNGVYFGTGDHSTGIFANLGTVTSDSRAVNIDGIGLEVVNEGLILGTGDQRNGTVYADATADEYEFVNLGTVDAGEGNNGSGVSLQTGDVDGDVVSALIENSGTIQGRGDASEGNQVGDGLRIFSNNDDVGFAGVVQNDGLIAGSEDSDAAAGIRIDGGVELLGAIVNDGEIRGTVNAIDARDGGPVTIVNDDDGLISGNVLLGDGDDVLVDLGEINGTIDGGAGDDVLIAGEGDNVIVGGLGDDFIDGGEGVDTADFSDQDVGVTVDLGANGNGTATRETGFSVNVQNQIVSAPDQFGSAIADGAAFVEQAVEGNLYYNLHTSDFPAGEIRGQLLVDSDVTEGNIRTIELSGGLDAAQEPGPLSDSDATGQANLVITQNLETGEVSYSSLLDVTGLSEADLSTPIPGVVSPIHLHNAPAGANGPVVQDTLLDAGATIDPDAGPGELGVIGLDVIENVTETDILLSIENVIGSDDDDILIGSDFDNVLVGGDGDDVLSGEGGDDILTGGAGVDLFVQGEGNDVVTDFQLGIDLIQLDDFGTDFDLRDALSQDGPDAVLSFSNGSSLTLQGVDGSLLGEDDFVS